MLNVRKTSPNRIDLHYEGALDAEGMRQALDALFTASEGIEDGVMLYEIVDFELPNIAAIGVELQRLPRLFKLVGRFRRCAVVTDTGWLRKAAEVEGRFFPGLDIRAFAPAEHAEAEAWLSGTA